MAHRIWKETKLQPGTAGPGNNAWLLLNFFPFSVGHPMSAGCMCYVLRFSILFLYEFQKTAQTCSNCSSRVFHSNLHCSFLGPVLSCAIISSQVPHTAVLGRHCHRPCSPPPCSPRPRCCGPLPFLEGYGKLMINHLTQFTQPPITHYATLTANRLAELAVKLELVGVRPERLRHLLPVLPRAVELVHLIVDLLWFKHSC